MASDFIFHGNAFGGFITCTPTLGWAPLTKGDRVRIREGYDGAGEIMWYRGKSIHDAGLVALGATEEIAVAGYDTDLFILAAAIEPYPYTREERIERAVEDYWFAANMEEADTLDNLLFAILDAGV
jgi:hypothetical protein